MAKRKKSPVKIEPAEEAVEVLEEKTEEVVVEEVKEEVDEVSEEAVEETTEEVVEEAGLKEISTQGTLGVHIREGGELSNLSFNGIRIENTDMRARSWDGCVIKDCVLESVVMQGCSFPGSDVSGNSFVNCDLRWAVLPGGFKENNEFINTRF